MALLHALLLLIGLAVLLPALRPERFWARLAAVLLLEFYTLRYFMWRTFETLPALQWNPAALWQWTFFGVESLATAYLCWSTFVLIRRSDHSALADVSERAARSRPTTPKVTVLIPTVNEPHHVLELTLAAARRIDYPHLEICVLDDDKGGTARVHAWLPALCMEYGVRYLRRPASSHAKAGNLNFGLSQTDGSIILVLDADFRATKNILWRTIGLLNEKIALVQTPQHYYSTDPIQHNLGGGRAWTEEQRHFFDVSLPSRDAWGNALCVGTGFVVRRDALGPAGFETGCLSEDVYGGYALLSRGHRILYLNEPLSFGAAADSVPEYIRQRVRWCQGILQAMWLPHGPLRARGLRPLDRLFYLDMPLYWVSQFVALAGVLIAPAVYFWTGVPVFECSLDDALAQVFPRIVASAMVSYWISGGRLMPVVTELKKLVGVVYILSACLSLIVHPGGKPFVPTLKAEQRDHIVIHWNILWPFLLLGAVVTVGLLRNLLTDAGTVPWNEYLPMNLALGLYVIGLLLLCSLACVDWPKDTRRANYRQTIEGHWLSALRALARPAVVGRER